MLALIRALGPVAAMLIGLACGSAIIGAAGWAYDEWIDDPHVRELAVRRERDACIIRTMAAAEQAAEAAEARWRRITDEAREADERQAAARDAARVRQIDQLNQEIAENERRLAAEGRSCPLDDATAEWLRYQWGIPAAD